jgi:uncharacterized protein YqjF (DUF2071 family)
MSIVTVPKKVFLSAKWENLVMLNYEVDPAILQKHVPLYTEVDLFEGKALVSVVGFLFNNTRVFGIQWPFHTNFDEVNLRYYIRYFDGSKWKRGVGFVSEIVSKPIIATIANKLYNEHYSVAKMKHQVTETPGTIAATYEWKKISQQWNKLSVQATNTLQPIVSGSAEEFIFEHYFGYNQLNKNTTIEYAVEHPRWEVYPVTNFTLQCDVAQLYGKEFVPFIENVQPHSVFLAKGSDVIVRKPVYLRGLK